MTIVWCHVTGLEQSAAFLVWRKLPYTALQTVPDESRLLVARGTLDANPLLALCCSIRSVLSFLTANLRTVAVSFVCHYLLLSGLCKASIK